MLEFIVTHDATIFEIFEILVEGVVFIISVLSEMLDQCGVDVSFTPESVSVAGINPSQIEHGIVHPADSGSELGIIVIAFTDSLGEVVGAVPVILVILS